MPMQTPVELELPLGFRFFPTDEEAIQHYLKKKVMGMPLPFDGIVLERNPYDEKQLPYIFAAAEKRDIYFFTKLTRKGRALDGHNFSRSVGNGTWRSERTVDIKDERGLLIGNAKTLGYTDKVSKKKLIMTEYALPTNDSSLPYNQSKDWVLCHVKLKARSKGGKNSGSSSVNNQEAPLLLHDHHYLEANAANSYNSSSMVNNDFYAPEVEATPTVNNLPLSCGAPEVEDDDLLQLIDTLPFPPVFDFDATPIDDFPSSTGDEFPPQSDFEDTLMGMDQVMDDNHAATPITDIPVSTGDEFPVLEPSQVAIEDIDFGLSDTLQPMETNQPNN